MTKITIPNEISVSLNLLLDLCKTHWSKYYRMQQNLVNGLTLYFNSLKLSPVENYPMQITASYFCSNKNRDPDNISVARKFWLDSLVHAGVIQGDSWKYISGFQDRFYIDKLNPRIEIEIRS